ncbi:serine hydrolase domain-containing protein [Terriglobus tenax]|uniref:serine hydrolase domain-containing protein n=1 Tax=Terriglobus tenax TaxID=1111115 RepID=UPI0021E01EBD|nr:serine hydrolase domain-containing protein [Terriglobus tenax]
MRFESVVRGSLLGAALFAAPFASQAQSTIHRLDGTTLTPAEASSIVRGTLTAGHITGAQIAILNHGRPVWVQSFGLRNVAQAQPINNDTVMYAASITKGVFATFVMQLVQANELDLDKPIAEYLPKPLPEYDKYKGLADDPRWQKITARHLLSHTSGLANFAALEPGGKLQLHFNPGTRFAYSGEGLNMLQFVIEQKTGRSLRDMMEEHLFTPLGMARTGMSWKDSFASNYADGYTPDGKLVEHNRRVNPRGAGSMDTTISDLVKFTQALLAGKLLNGPSQAQMFAPQIQIHTAHQFPTLTEELSDEPVSVGLAYGLGWGLLTNTRYGRAFFKEGHGDGAQNYMICFEKTQDCMIMLTNSENGELAFKPLFEKLLGDTVTPWEWESYTPEQIRQNQINDHPELAPPPAPKPKKQSWVKKEAEKLKEKTRKY